MSEDLRKDVDVTLEAPSVNFDLIYTNGTSKNVVATFDENSAKKLYSYDGETWFDYDIAVDVDANIHDTVFLISQDADGNYSDVTIVDIEKPTDVIKIPKNASAIIEEDVTVKSLNIASATKVNKKQQYTEAIFVGKLNGTDANNVFTLGNYNNILVDGMIDTGLGNDTLKIGSYSGLAAQSGIALGEGNNTLTVGKNSWLYSGGAVTGASKITFAANNKNTDLPPNEKVSSYLDSISGTDKNNVFSFGNYTTTEVGGSIDTLEGNDTIKIGSYATFNAGNVDLGSGTNSLIIGKDSSVVLDAVKNASKITTSSDSVVTFSSLTGTEARDVYSFGSNNFVTIEDANANAGDISTGDGNDSLKIGQNTFFLARNVDLGDGKNDISIGSNSTALIEGNATGLNKLTVSSNAKDNTINKVAISGTITGTIENDVYNIGNYNNVDVKSIELGDGNDTLKIGSYTTFYSGDIDLGAGANSLTIGKDTNVMIGNVLGANKITASANSVDSDATTVMDSVTGTDGNDVYSFGNNSKVSIEDINANAADINTGAGNDTLKLGQNSFLLANNLVLGEGKNSFTIGSNSTVLVEGVVSDLNKLTIAANSKDNEISVSSFSGGITGTLENDSYTIGNYTDIDAKSIDMSDGTDTLKIGSYADVNVTEISNAELITIGKDSTVKIDILNGVNGINAMANTKDTSIDYVTDHKIVLGTVNGTIEDDYYIFGNYTTTEITCTVNTGDGDGDIKIGSNAWVAGSDIDFGTGANTLVIGANSTVELTGALGLWKLNISASSKGNVYDYTHVTKLTGTEYDDTYNFGNYTQVDIGTLDMGVGEDTLKLGSYGVYNIFELSNVEKFTIGTGSYVSQALYDALGEYDPKLQAKAQLIGENDSFATAEQFVLEKKTTGFLNSNADVIDYYSVGDFENVKLSKNAAVELTYLDVNGIETSMEEASFVSVSLKDDFKGTFSYSILAS